MEDIILRVATIADAEIVFDWRNAPETREYFFDPQPLNKAEHITWFTQSLTMPSRCLLIAELDKKPAGVLRFDFVKQRAEIDIYLCPGLKGQGLGTRILLAGNEWIKRHFPMIETLEAKIIANNVASTRAFEKSGFDIKVIVMEKKIGTL